MILNPVRWAWFTRDGAGSVQNVIGKTIRRMVSDFSADPSAILAGIGPSLGPCCAEFIHFHRELPVDFHPYRKDLLFDFWSISRDQMIAGGVRPDNIEVSGICTKCGGNGFYSYRGEQKKTGRFGLIAARRKQ